MEEAVCNTCEKEIIMHPEGSWYHTNVPLGRNSIHFIVDEMQVNGTRYCYSPPTYKGPPDGAYKVARPSKTLVVPPRPVSSEDVDDVDMMLAELEGLSVPNVRPLAHRIHAVFKKSSDGLLVFDAAYSMDSTSPPTWWGDNLADIMSEGSEYREVILDIDLATLERLFATPTVLTTVIKESS